LQQDAPSSNLHFAARPEKSGDPADLLSPRLLSVTGFPLRTGMSRKILRRHDRRALEVEVPDRQGEARGRQVYSTADEIEGQLAWRLTLPNTILTLADEVVG